MQIDTYRLMYAPENDAYDRHDSIGSVVEVGWFFWGSVGRKRLKRMKKLRKVWGESDQPDQTKQTRHNYSLVIITTSFEMLFEVRASCLPLGLGSTTPLCTRMARGSHRWADLSPLASATDAYFFFLFPAVDRHPERGIYLLRFGFPTPACCACITSHVTYPNVTPPMSVGRFFFFFFFFLSLGATRVPRKSLLTHTSCTAVAQHFPHCPYIESIYICITWCKWGPDQ